MAASFNKSYKQINKTTTKAADKLVNQNNVATKAYNADMSKIYDNTVQNLKNNAAQSTARLNQDFQAGYDLNAVRQLVAERQLRERMANSGLSDSGLNRTQQTAIAAQRMNADSALQRQKYAAGAQIESQLANDISNTENSRLSTIAQANLANAQNNTNLRGNLLNTAISGALSSFNNDKQIDYNKWNVKQQINANEKNAKTQIAAGGNNVKTQSGAVTSYDKAAQDEQKQVDKIKLDPADLEEARARYEIIKKQCTTRSRDGHSYNFNDAMARELMGAWLESKGNNHYYNLKIIQSLGM